MTLRNLKILNRHILIETIDKIGYVSQTIHLISFYSGKWEYHTEKSILSSEIFYVELYKKYLKKLVSILPIYMLTINDISYKAIGKSVTGESLSEVSIATKYCNISVSLKHYKECSLIVSIKVFIRAGMYLQEQIVQQLIEVVRKMEGTTI